MRILPFLATVLPLVFAACSDTKFSSTSTPKVKSTSQPKTDDLKVDRTEDENPENIPSLEPVETTPTPSKTPEGPTTSPKTPEVEQPPGLPPVQECEINPHYDPTAISCSIDPAHPDAIWNHVPVWKQNASQFKDKTARWISPLPQVTDPSGYILCPELPESDMLIYVSSFEVKEKQDYSIEVINDNGGDVFIWKDGDSNQEVAKFFSNEVHSPKTQHLIPGHYAAVITSADGGVASSILFSLQDANGQVVKKSHPSDNWCIFRVPAGTDPIGYVNQAGKCRKCLIGPNGK